MNYAKHENVLLAIIRDYKSIDELLEMFFSFLKDKTDFYHLMLDEEDVDELSKKYKNTELFNKILNNNNYGFKTSERENNLIKLFRKYQIDYVIEQQPYLIENEKLKKKYLPYCNQKIILKNDVKEKTHIKENNESNKLNKSLNNTNNKTNTNENHITTWNGGQTDKYFWNQTFSEVNLEIPICNEININDVNVLITNKNIKVEYKGEIKLEGEFYENVNKEDCMWNIEDKKKIIISLEKKRENWWSCVLKGDVEIDTKKIESKKNLSDFDEKTQNELRKFLLKQKLKNEGYKTAEEIKTQEFLKYAMKQPDKPNFL